MGLKKIVGAMLAATLAVTLTALPLLAQPLKPRACCGKSCPPPPQSAPNDCCKIVPLPSASVTVAPLTPLPLLAWALVVVMAQPVPQTTSQVVPFTQDPSPPQTDRLVVSGLAPPSLA